MNYAICLARAQDTGRYHVLTLRRLTDEEVAAAMPAPFRDRVYYQTIGQTVGGWRKRTQAVDYARALIELPGHQGQTLPLLDRGHDLAWEGRGEHCSRIVALRRRGIILPRDWHGQIN